MKFDIAVVVGGNGWPEVATTPTCLWRQDWKVLPGVVVQAAFRFKPNDGGGTAAAFDLKDRGGGHWAEGVGSVFGAICRDDALCAAGGENQKIGCGSHRVHKCGTYIVGVVAGGDSVAFVYELVEGGDDTIAQDRIVGIAQVNTLSVECEVCKETLKPRGQHHLIGVLGCAGSLPQDERHNAPNLDGNSSDVGRKERSERRGAFLDITDDTLSVGVAVGEDHVGGCVHRRGVGMRHSHRLPWSKYARASPRRFRCQPWPTGLATTVATVAASARGTAAPRLPHNHCG